MKKLRTRQHIIEDLGFNHIEKQVLLAGFVQRRYYTSDYGYDGCIDTFSDMGEIENLSIMFQLKSTDNILLSNQNKGCIFDLDKRDLELWLSDIRPVILILFDAKKEIAYFINLQIYFQENRKDLANVRKFVRVYLPQTAILDAISIIVLKKMLNNKK
jgi:Domain of unknown function (DUF4365)